MIHACEERARSPRSCSAGCKAWCWAAQKASLPWGQSALVQRHCCPLCTQIRQESFTNFIFFLKIQLHLVPKTKLDISMVNHPHGGWGWGLNKQTEGLHSNSIQIIHLVNTDRLTPVWSRPLRWRSNRTAASGGMEGILITLNKHIFSSRWLFVFVTCFSFCWKVPLIDLFE